MGNEFPKHRAALAWAVKQIGQREVPAGSNRGPFVEYCQRHTWLGGTGWPWCAAFVLAAVNEGGGVRYPDRTAGAWDMLNRARPRGWALPPSSRTVVPGDIVVFNIGSGHVAIVEKVTPTAVTSIDGNSNDQVRRCTRDRSTVRGFIHWPEDLPAIPPVRPPRVQVVTSASGSRKLVTRCGVKVPLPARKDKVT